MSTGCQKLFDSLDFEQPSEIKDRYPSRYWWTEKIDENTKTRMVSNFNCDILFRRIITAREWFEHWTIVK